MKAYFILKEKGVVILGRWSYCMVKPLANIAERLLYDKKAPF